MCVSSILSQIYISLELSIPFYFNNYELTKMYSISYFRQARDDISRHKMEKTMNKVR